MQYLKTSRTRALYLVFAPLALTYLRNPAPACRLHGQPTLLAQQATGSFPASGFAVSACNRVRSQPCLHPPSDSSTVISYHSPVAPLSKLDQEAHELKPRQCLLLRSRLPGHSWACVIVASDCEPFKRLNRAIGRILLAELGEKRQAYFLPRRPAYLLGRCDAETLQEHGSSTFGHDCVSATLGGDSTHSFRLFAWQSGVWLRHLASAVSVEVVKMRVVAIRSRLVSSPTWVQRRAE